jgi:hypothetical protein
VPEVDRLHATQALLQRVLPDMKVPGLELSALRFDYLRQCFLAGFSANGQNITVVLRTERIEDLARGVPLSRKRLREEITRAFGLPD